MFPKSTSADDNLFKIYAFIPNDTTDLEVSEYGNIVIKGTLPELILNEKEYELEVEYENKNGRVSYNVEKILTSVKPTTGEEAFTYLSEFTSPARAISILKVYPNIIDMIQSGEKIDTSKIKGVGDATMNVIAQKVKEQYVYYDLIVEFKDYEFTINQVVKLHKHYKTTESVREAMKKNPYVCLCSVMGIGFKTADEKILRKNREFLKSKFRITEAIQYILSQNETNGHTYMLTDDLYSECKELVPECISLFHKALEKSNRVYVTENKDKVAKLKTYVYEKEVAEMLLALKNNNVTWKDNNGEILKSGSIAEKYKYIGDLKLTAEQQKIIPMIIDNNVVILAGYAGAGKSASCQALIDWLEDNCKSYLLLAPTGRAASVLANYTNRSASTIHRALGAKGNFEFEYNEDNKLFTDIVIVDESTMIDVFLFRALLKALPDYCKILFVCDPAQIPSVGAGNVIQDMIRSNIFTNVVLDKVFRYDDGGLSYVATKTRQGEHYLTKDDYQIFGKNKDYVFTQVDDEEVVENAVNKYVHLYKNGTSINDMVVVSCYNKGKYGTLNINNIIQEAINPPKKKNDNKVGYTKDNINVFFNEGDRVMQTKNNYHAKKINDDEFDEECALFNGDFGIVKEITDGGALICVFGENTIKIPKSDVKDLTLGYCVSCHKMQGDSRENIIYITPKSHTYMLNRNLMYVALTRAKRRLYHYGNTSTVRSSLRKSENLSRKTFLEKLLRLM